MPVTYRIKHWTANFENAESRKVRNLQWVPVPNKHDGKSYRRLASHKSGVEVFCAWCLMVEVASKMPDRGILADEDGPLTSDDLAFMTGFPARIFTLAFLVLTSKGIEWLETVEGTESQPSASGNNRDLPETSGNAGAEGKGREGQGIEDNQAALGSTVPGEPATVAAADPQGVGEPNRAAELLIFPTVKGRRDGPESWAFVESHRAELQECFPSLDILAQARIALNWVRCDPTRRKTADGMKRFMLGWMTRAQNYGTARNAGPANENPQQRARRLAGTNP